MVAMTRYTQLDDRFVRYWNQWYTAAAAGAGAEAHALAADLRDFLTGEHGNALILETVARAARRKVRLPLLRSFLFEVEATLTSLQTFLTHPMMSPDPLSEYLANMQTYMALCR